MASIWPPCVFRRDRPPVSVLAAALALLPRCCPLPCPNGSGSGRPRRNGRPAPTETRGRHGPERAEKTGSSCDHIRRVMQRLDVVTFGRRGPALHGGDGGAERDPRGAGYRRASPSVGIAACQQHPALVTRLRGAHDHLCIGPQCFPGSCLSINQPTRADTALLSLQRSMGGAHRELHQSLQHVDEPT